VSSIAENLDKLTSFHTRYYRSSTGAAAGRWVQSRVEQYAATADKNWNITIMPFPHPWAQSSYIVRLEDRNLDKEGDDAVVILGAHIDSVNWLNPWFGRSPGADDDGSGPLHPQVRLISGTATLLEIARVIFEHYFPLSRPLEFHFYSGEEGGLKGSQAISEVYQSSKRPVVGMLQLDMTGFWDKSLGRKMGIVGDYTDPALTSLLRLVVDEYTDETTGRLETQCAYACSGTSLAGEGLT
jgi:bacterial leucyl aminopeptidase